MKFSISVVIISHNSSKFIHKAFASIINQTINVNEVIIVDDKSEDLESLKKVILHFQKVSKIKFRLITNSKNYGPGYSRNLGWSKCKTDFIAFLDDDDVWHKDKLKIQMEILNNNKDIILLACRKSLNFDLNIKNLSSQKLFKINFYKLIFKNLIPTSGVIIKNDIKERFLHDYHAEDYYLWLLVTKRYNQSYFLDINLCKELIVNKVKLTSDVNSLYKSINTVLGFFYNDSFINNFLVNLAKFSYLLKKYINNNLSIKKNYVS